MDAIYGCVLSRMNVRLVRSLSDEFIQRLFLVGLTAVFISIFMVWLPGPAAGLQLIGFEMGEWVKFLGVDLSRNLFYLPPMTLGFSLAMWTAVWPNGRWQTWLMRGVALLVSLLAFPAWNDITGGSQIEYVPRLWFIGFVGLAILLSIGLSWFDSFMELSVKLTEPHAKPQRRKDKSSKKRLFINRLPWLLIAIVSILGGLLPTWIYTAVKPIAEQWLQLSLGTGIGVWVNGAGHLLITAVCLVKLVDS